MYNAKINDRSSLKLKNDLKNNLISINDESFQVEIFQESHDVLRLKLDGKIFEALILKHNTEEKTFLLKINQNKYSVKIEDKYDELLAKLGMDLTSSKKHNNVKAPMPGLVLDVLVKEGAKINKGEPLVILEAMKMENILKAPSDATIKKILVNKGNSVEKNQLLIELS